MGRTFRYLTVHRRRACKTSRFRNTLKCYWTDADVEWRRSFNLDGTVRVQTLYARHKSSLIVHICNDYRKQCCFSFDKLARRGCEDVTAVESDDFRADRTMPA